MKIIYVIICCFVIVLIHEFTHFIVATLLRMPVKSIDIGNGKCIFSLSKINIYAFFFLGGRVVFDDGIMLPFFDQTTNNVTDRNEFLKFLIKDTICTLAAPLMDGVWLLLFLNHFARFNNELVNTVIFMWALSIVTNLSPVLISFDKKRPFLYTDGGVAILNLVYAYQTVKQENRTHWVSYKDFYRISMPSLRWYHHLLVYLGGFIILDLFTAVIGFDMNRVSFAFGYGVSTSCISFIIARSNYVLNIH